MTAGCGPEQVALDCPGVSVVEVPAGGISTLAFRLSSQLTALSLARLLMTMTTGKVRRLKMKSIASLSASAYTTRRDTLSTSNFMLSPPEAEEELLLAWLV
jgi:hypothetical protein